MGNFGVRRRTWPMSHPIPRPTATPPAPVTKSWSAAWPGEKVPVTTAATPIRYATRAVASLTSPSPSNSVTIRRGAPRRRITATAATGSGGDTMAPSTKAAGQVISGRSAWATPATTAMVSSTTRVPYRAMGQSCARKSRSEVVSEAQ